jgi:hypothetical protein
MYMFSPKFEIAESLEGPWIQGISIENNNPALSMPPSWRVRKKEATQDYITSHPLLVCIR